MTSMRHHSNAVEADARFTDVTLLCAASRSQTYEARCRATGRRLMIKVPYPADSEWAVEATLREGAILGRIGSHPNVVTLYQQVKLRDGRPALVLERVAGSLADLTGAYRPGVALVVSLGIRLCGALETLHGAGFLHTDVRPANVLVTEWGELALAGFDEAVPLLDAGSHALHATTPYTAPELLEGAAPTPATDVYGLAVTLFDVLAGRPPFPVYDGEPASETSLRILRGVHAPVPPSVPIPLADLLEWGLAVDPTNRPPSAAWFAEELRRLEQAQHWPRTPLQTSAVEMVAALN